MKSSISLLILLLCVVVSTLVSAMKFEDFKKCDQSGFCRRNREYADTVSSSPYLVLKESISISNGNVKADIKNTETNILLTLDVQLLKDNTARVRINEKSPIKPRYDQHAKFTLVRDPEQAEGIDSHTSDTGVVTLHMDKSRKIVISPQPVRIEFLVDNEPVITLNDRGFFHFEHLRTKESHVPKMVEKKNDDGSVEMVKADSEKDLWEETFKTWTDPKPNGKVKRDIIYILFSFIKFRA